MTLQATKDGQIEWRGLLFGGPDNPYRWLDLQGWDDLPGQDLSDAARTAGHGDLPGLAFTEPRIVSWEFRIRQIPGEDFATSVDALRAATAPRADSAEEPLIIRIGGERRLVWARCVGRRISNDPEFALGHARGVIQWKATDPLRYSPIATQSMVGLPQPGDGFVYPIAYPLDYGTTGSGGSVTVVNGGAQDVPSPPVLTVRGPATNPVVTNVTTGRSLRFALTLAASDLLTVDVRAGTVLLNGLADREGATSGLVSAFLLAPGLNELTFRASGFEPGALLGVAFRSATM